MTERYESQRHIDTHCLDICLLLMYVSPLWGREEHDDLRLLRAAAAGDDPHGRQLLAYQASDHWEGRAVARVEHASAVAHVDRHVDDRDT